MCDFDYRTNQTNLTKSSAIEQKRTHSNKIERNRTESGIRSSSAGEQWRLKKWKKKLHETFEIMAKYKDKKDLYTCTGIYTLHHTVDRLVKSSGLVKSFCMNLKLSTNLNSNLTIFSSLSVCFDIIYIYILSVAGIQSIFSFLL